MIEFDVRHYDSIGSTSDEVLRLAREGAPYGTCVCAREQTSGRGRRGRNWYSPRGNLYVSLLLRSRGQRSQELSFVTALAVADAVDTVLPSGVRAALKWPNDVQVAGAKIAGILIEHSDMDAATIVGIGVNVRHAPTEAPYPVTSLIAQGTGDLSPDDLLPSLLDAFGRREADWQQHGFARTRIDWRARAHPAGTLMRTTVGDDVMLGRFVDLAPDGALILDTPEGSKRLVAGEVTLSG